MTSIMNDGRKDVILIVDDQPANLKVVASVLSDEYAISIANNGRNALKMLEQGIPDLILLDIMMPDMDGFEVCREIKKIERLKDIPIIFLTAKTEAEDIIKGFEYGAVDYISKPFNSTEMKIRVKNHLNLYHAVNDIRKINAEKDKFLSIVSHDLRSPFFGLLGLTDLLAEDYRSFSDMEIAEITQNLSKLSHSIYDLLEKLLEWAKMERGLIEYRPTAMPLTKVTTESLDVLCDLAKEKSIELDVNVPEQEVFADYYMLQTIIRNLVSNAIKFTKRGGKVTVSSRKTESDRVLLTVADSGIGMNEEILRNLFRIDGITKRPGTDREQSSGLGLLLCKDFVEKQGGNIWAESKEGLGSIFYFTMPINN